MAEAHASLRALTNKEVLYKGIAIFLAVSIIWLVELFALLMLISAYSENVPVFAYCAIPITFLLFEGMAYLMVSVDFGKLVYCGDCKKTRSIREIELYKHSELCGACHHPKGYDRFEVRK